MNKRLLIIVGLISVSFLVYSTVSSEEYDATVTTDSGSYSVSVEVEDGEVTQVYWPNGGDMTVSGAEISGSEATGFNSRGDSISIELDNYDEESEESEE